MTDTLISPVPTTTGTDDSALTHIVDCPDDKESAEAWVTEARVFGLEVTALCGFVWVAERDPERHPICPTCLDIANIRLA
jgi:hypothetical protein